MAGTKPVIFVAGSSGNIGKATVHALSAQHGDKVEIRAGVRNPDKVGDLAKLPGVKVVQAEMGNVELKETLKGVNALYIVTPGIENRAAVTIATAEYAKAAGVQFLLVVSVPTVDLTDTVFGRQLNEIEVKVKGLGIPYSFLRLPLFMDNAFMYKEGIQTQSAIYSTLGPDKPFTVVAVEDAGKAAAVILTNPTKYTNTTFTIISDAYTSDELAKGFSTFLGREIKYVQIPESAASEAMSKLGIQEWQLKGMFELNHLIDSGSPITHYQDRSAYKTITGQDPTTLTQWINKFGAAFK